MRISPTAVPLRGGLSLCFAAVAIMAEALPVAAAQPCPNPPPAVRDLDIPRFYSDAAGSKVDPRLKAANEAAVAPLVAFLREVTAEADAALRSTKVEKRQETARCALSWLEAWARGGAWLGRVDQQGEAQRKWDLTGTALAYVKVKPYATPEQRKVIETWLLKVAGAARAYFDDPGRKRNNHWYWLGLGLAGVAIATGDERQWATARDIARDAARDIRDDGALPMELARAERALHYHAFAVMPLVVLAEIARARGEDFYAFNDGALHRLVALTVRGLDDPAVFEKLSSVRQALVPSTPGVAWLPLYRRHFSAALGGNLPSMKTADRRFGGDALLLIEMLAAGRKGR